jgi:hypothetical protein
MVHAITPEGRALWLMLARQGGWWTVKGIVQFWTPTFADFEVQEIVGGLMFGGFLMARNMVPGADPSYAVTSECTALPGVDLQGVEWREAA